MLKKNRQLCLLISLWLTAGLTVPFSPALAQQEELTIETLAKTQAAKYYIAKQYQKSLDEFLVLEELHPSNLLIKRYLADLWDHLNQTRKAIQKLKEVLSIRPDDLTARQMIADFYMKQGEWKEASLHLGAVMEAQPAGPLAEKAQKKLEKIQVLRGAQTVPGKTLSPQDFMQSPAAKTFSEGRFEEAFAGFEQLSRQYPEDVLIRRFKAMALMRLKRYDQSYQAFRETLALDPQNAAAHYYLGEAYLEAKDMEKARKEFQWVIEQGKENYAAKARHAIFKTIGKGAARAAKRWTFSGSAGYEYDTNAIFKSNDRNFSSSGDQNSSRYLTTLSGTYRLAEKDRWSFTGDALYSQVLYEDFPNLQTYTPGFGLSAAYKFKLFNHPAIFNVRDGATVTYLKNKFFVWSHTLSPMLVAFPHPKVKSTVSYRWSVSEYDSNGTQPDTTSRDGFANVLSTMQTVYLGAQKRFAVNIGYDFERHDTSGRNYIRNVHAPSLGLSFPVLEKIKGDISFKVKDSNYNQYESTPPKRRDEQFTLSCMISRPITSSLVLALTYLLEDTRAKNNIYETTRHVFGAKLNLNL